MNNSKTVLIVFIAERQLTRWLAQKTSYKFPIKLKKCEYTELKIPIHSSWPKGQSPQGTFFVYSRTSQPIIKILTPIPSAKF